MLFLGPKSGDWSVGAGFMMCGSCDSDALGVVLAVGVEIASFSRAPFLAG